MCLANVDSPTKFTKRRIGYKVFKGIPGSLKTVYFSHRQDAMIEGETYHSSTGMVEMGINEERYPEGFHVWLTENDARKWKDSHAYGGSVYKVKVSEVVASGFYSYRASRILVARTMTILKKVS